jgi:hypothetical protein
MADIDRVQLLIGLSNNMRTDNDAWRKEVFQEGRARALRAREMMNLFEQEYAALSREFDSLQQYLPRQAVQGPESMPKAATQGPRT